MDIDTFLNSRIRIQINLINAITSDLDTNRLNDNGAGTLIAQANNATQNVKPDDLFGNKNKRELEQQIFKNFNKQFNGKVSIEYRYGEIMGKSSDEKVHILTLLRPVIPTGILSKDKDIYEFTNQRAPVYSLFEKLLRKVGSNQRVIDIISQLIPLLYKIRTDYVVPILESHKRELIRQYKQLIIGGDYSSFHNDLKEELKKAGTDDEKIEKIIKRNVHYNIEHIMPVIVFRIRKLFKEENNKVVLSIDNEQQTKVLPQLIKAIYESYIKMRLSGLPSSLTTEVRRSKFYEFATETYNVLKEMYHWNESDFVTTNSFHIK